MKISPQDLNAYKFINLCFLAGLVIEKNKEDLYLYNSWVQVRVFSQFQILEQ